ncbi:MAG: histidine kinase, partial [Oscillospiraceae bacterium]|nr:histidine kinase [Oscillospiraceae bacterium]
QATKGIASGAAFALYDAGGRLQFTTQESIQEPQLQVYWGILRKAAQAGGTAYLPQPENAASSDSICLRAAHEVLADNGSRIGYMVCNITTQQMRQIFSGLFSDTATLFLFTPQGHLMYASRSGMEEESLQLRENLLRGTLPLQEDMHYFFCTDEATGCLLVMRQPAALSTHEVGLMRTISLSAAGVSLVLCIIFSFLLSRSLSSPIERLSAAMHQVRTGDLTARVPIERQDEIGQLTEDFNVMTAQLKAYLAEQVQHEKDLNDARIRQLQAQLNPHFLYNTLDTMKWLAKIHKVPQVARLAGSLGGILRSSIASEQFITLRQELALVEHYIDIQKIRFAGKFEYVIDVPQELMDMIVPKLILQPLVENSILHGLEASENGYIYIYARSQGKELTIAITDDGCGMPQSMVERLNSDEPKMLEGHLGLYNVGRILQLYYGPGYGLHATSKAQVGTTVTVRIPATKEDTHA